MDKKIRTAIIGGGKNGLVRGFLIHSHPDFELTSVVDQNPAQEKMLSRILRVPGFSTIEAAVHQFQPDLLIFCNRSETNSHNIHIGLENQLHLFLSHPECCDYYQSKQLLHHARMLKINLLFGHPLNFRPTFSTMQNFLSDGSISDISFIKAGLQIHSLIELTNSTASSSTTKLIRASAKRIFPLLSLMLSFQGQVATLRAHKPSNSVENAINSLAIISRFCSEINGVIELSWLYPKFPQRAKYSLLYSGTGGMAIAEPSRLSLLFQKDNKRFKAGKHDFHTTEVALFPENRERYWGIYREMDLISDTIIKGVDSPLSWEKAHHVIEVMEGIIRSVENDTTVNFPLPRRTFSKKNS
ncbi:hypothetical protein GF337_02540 [candidate division KSB1 bacterium]|nr:hypothetical protein [candidate division KSB1 bacterium]